MEDDRRALSAKGAVWGLNARVEVQVCSPPISVEQTWGYAKERQPQERDPRQTRTEFEQASQCMPL